MANDHKPGCDALGGYGHGVGPCTCGALTAPVATEQAQAVAAGWKAAPLEPTEEMVAAGMRCMFAEKRYTAPWDDVVNLMYRAMLAASPEAAPAAMEDGCALGCAESCMAKEHGCASECPALPWQPAATREHMRQGYTGCAVRRALETLVECASYGDVSQDADAWIDARAALAQPAPVQQDAPAPSMVGDAVDALRQLVEQIEKAAPVDDHGHLFTMNTAFIRAKEML